MGKDSLDFVDNTTVFKIGFFLFLKEGLAIQLSHDLDCCEKLELF